ncbi:GNAT family N-acetyltransferase [Rhizobium terricola]|uniref:GNAT family N-acetyltransferase n=1 Tax=Rhizobium terricola TaxID=2728849 RepID=UPI0028F44512|nr:GNAT family N-acetyltransferase [Rhizobium terricola]
MEIRRVDQSFDRHGDLLELILRAFAYMDWRIDPPSSAHRLTPALLKEKASQECAFVAQDGGRLAGCIFLKPEPDALYIGKLAVEPTMQGRGIGRRLLVTAEATAREHGLKALRLETRIELIENHRVFSGWGFHKTAENRHAGFDRTTSIEMRRELE